jgi:hypothetical protein
MQQQKLLNVLLKNVELILCVRFFLEPVIIHSPLLLQVGNFSTSSSPGPRLVSEVSFNLLIFIFCFFVAMNLFSFLQRGPYAH